MGKRKKSSKKPQGPKKREPLPTTFQCLFCNHENAVSVKLDKKAGIGHLSCKVCGQTYQHSINYLSAAIDVYSEWVDACDAVAQEAAVGDSAGKTAGSSYRDIDVSSRGAAARAEGLAREDDFIDDDEDAEGDFADE